MALQKFENFLRINRLSRSSDVIRARAVYMIALTFLLSQIANFILLTYTYGHWTFDHTIGAIISMLVAMSIITLRYSKKFAYFAGFYSLLLFSGIILSANTDFTGINSALIPFLLLGAIINGFISGWRTVLVFGAAAITCVWYLHFISTSAPTGVLFDPALFENRILQRSIQSTIALSLISIIVSFSSYHMHSSFFMLEEKIKEIEEVEKRRSMFLADMSHELRTPLNGILGFCGLLKNTALNPQQVQYSDIVSKSANTLHAIINDALELSKIDTGHFKLNNAPFDLTALINSTIDLFQPVAIKKGLILGTRYQSNFPQIFIGDENQIRRILNNLISNSIKFTEHGSIFITVEKDHNMATDHTVKISVIDTGIGIADENKNAIFERFSQIKKPSNNDTEGTGLGLALCKEIIANMHGRIEIVSEPDQGSTFSMHLEMPTATQEDITAHSEASLLEKSPQNQGNAIFTDTGLSKDNSLELTVLATEQSEAA